MVGVYHLPQPGLAEGKVLGGTGEVWLLRERALQQESSVWQDGLTGSAVSPGVNTPTGRRDLSSTVSYGHCAVSNFSEM